MPFFERQVLGSPGDWRMVGTQANGQPAVVGYQLSSDGVHRVYAIAVLAVTGGGIARITTFGTRARSRGSAPRQSYSCGSGTPTPSRWHDVSPIARRSSAGANASRLGRQASREVADR
jgi:hypothetical protein